MSENNEDASEVTRTLIDELVDFFRYPVYTWDVTKKRAFLILDALARWNPEVGVLYQDQLINMCGLDIGPSTGPNTLRATRIAMTRATSFRIGAEGNGMNRIYTFNSLRTKNEVLQFMTLPKWERIRKHLANEILEHRRRGW